jgi:prophage regulatory protein
MSDRFLRIKQVCGKVGWCRGTLYRELKAGRFPQPRQLGFRAVGFLESEVDTWMRGRPIADPKNQPVSEVAGRRRAAKQALELAEDKAGAFALDDAGLKRPLEAYRDFRMQENF